MVNQFLPKSKVYRIIKAGNRIGNMSSCVIRGNMYFEDERGFLKEKEFSFPSSEHFWWAHFLSKEKDIRRFSVGGNLSSLDTENSIIRYFLISRQMDDVGIIAKFASKKDVNGVRSNSILLGLKMSDKPFKAYGENKKSTIKAIWRKILGNKFYQNPHHRRALLSTGNKLLVEFAEDPGFWTGNVKNGSSMGENLIRGGTLEGGNFMGKCFMETRKDMNKFMSKPFLKLNPKLCKFLISSSHVN